MPFDSLPENNTTIPQVVLDLIAARSYLDTHGWCKGQMERGPKRCMLGAVRQVTLTEHIRITPNAIKQQKLNCELQQREVQANGALAKAIQRSSRSAPLSIPTWNDLKSRTYAQVRALFDNAINYEQQAK